MKDESQAYVQYRIEMARDSLEVAEAALKLGKMRDALNRMYYACFHAVTALLKLEGHVSTKHRGIAGLFNQHWILSGRLPRDYGRVLHQIYESRQDADYKEFVAFDPSEVEGLLRKSSEFVAVLEAKIQTLLKQPSTE